MIRNFQPDRMTARLIELHPQPGGSRELAGTWLELDLHRLARQGAPLIYGSFVSSLDGRIAVADPQSGRAAFCRRRSSAATTFASCRNLWRRPIASSRMGDICGRSHRVRSTTFCRSGSVPAAQTLRAGAPTQGFQGQPGDRCRQRHARLRGAVVSARSRTAADHHHRCERAAGACSTVRDARDSR